MKYLVFVVAALCLSLLLATPGEKVFGQTKKPLTADEIEQLRSMQEAIQSLDRLKVAAENLLQAKFHDCLKAFGYNPFCECLRDNLPIGLGFQSYVRVITANKVDLNYPKLTKDDRAMVDQSYKAREKCVAALPAKQ